MSNKITDSDICQYLQDKYAIYDNKRTPCTLGFTIQVRKIDDNEIYIARIFRGAPTYGIRTIHHATIKDIYLKSEISAIVDARTITNMAPEVIAVVPDIDQIDISIKGICCIVIVEDITVLPSIDTIECSTTKLQILYNVGIAISALHAAGIYYKTFNSSCICIQGDTIRLKNINQNFTFEISIGLYSKRVRDRNNYFISPELLNSEEGLSEQKIDAYGFGVCIFICIFGKYAFFPVSDENRRAYGARNPIPSDILEKFKRHRLEIWDGLQQPIKNLFGGLLDTCHFDTNGRRFERAGGFVLDTEQSCRGLLCQDPDRRLTIAESLDNDWFREI